MSSVSVTRAPQRFERLDPGTTGDLGYAWVAPGDAIWITGGRRIVRRYDGSTWKDTSAGLPEDPYLGTLDELWGDDSGVLVGGGRDALFMYDGAKWRRALKMQECGAPVSVHGISGGAIYASCPYPHFVLRFPREEPARAAINEGVDNNQIRANREDDVFVLHISGTIFRYRGHQGDGWIEAGSWSISFNSPGFLHDLWPVGDDQMVAVGDDGSILRWNGERWSRESSSTKANLRSVWGSPEDGVFTVGEDGVALWSSGEAWRPIPTGTTATLRAVRGRSGGAVVAVGDHGTVLRVSPT